MTAVISSTTLGLYGSELTPFGSSGSGGSGASDRLFLNTATGNLIIQQQDEYLSSLGVNLGIIRTYNSQGGVDGDNNDAWRLGVYRSLYNLPSTPNQAGSTVTKVYGDGHEAIFTFDASRGLYVSIQGDGPHDTLSYSGGTWTFTDGTDAYTETYDSTGKLLSIKDSDGNTQSFSYTGTLVTHITLTPTGGGAVQDVYLDYTGNNLTKIRVITAGQTQTTTQYRYDAQNRLSQVIVDLTPTDNSIAAGDPDGNGIYATVNGQTYVTTYTYEGSSTRLASITNGDGTTVAFSYTQVSGQYKLHTVTDGVGNITTYDYTGGGSPTSTTANANQGLLSTTDTQVTTQNYNLNTGALSQGGTQAWTGSQLLDTTTRHHQHRRQQRPGRDRRGRQRLCHLAPGRGDVRQSLHRIHQYLVGPL